MFTKEMVEALLKWERESEPKYGPLVPELKNIPNMFAGPNAPLPSETCEKIGHKWAELVRVCRRCGFRE